MSTYDMPTRTTGGAGDSTAPQDKSLGDLFADLTRDTAKLMRQEVQLAQVEMTQKAVKVAKDAVMVAAGGLVALVGVILLLVSIALFLAEHMAPWLAFLITAIALAVIGGAVAMSGLAALKKVDPLPRQTIETLKEDAQALTGR